MGEVTRNTILGNNIYQLILNNNFENIVEIGGWDGTGTTQCIIDALVDSNNLSCNVYSVELDENRHMQAVTNFKNCMCKSINFLNGSLHGGDMDISHAKAYINMHQEEFKQQQKDNFNIFFKQNLKLLANCKSMKNKLPTNIDLLILDGGEYTTYHEYITFTTDFSVKYLALDDANMLKSKYIINDILKKGLAQQIIMFDKIDRNGSALIQL